MGKEEIDTEETKSSQFNAGLMRVQHLNELIVQATLNFQSGNELKWYNSLRAIKFIIISKLSKEEREELKTQEIKINKNPMHNKIINIKDLTEDQKKEVIRNSILKEIENYSEMLMDLMEKKDLLIPSKEDNTKFA